MRSGCCVLALVIVALLVGAGGAAGDVTDPGNPTFANNILSDFVTPTVAPGETVEFSFNVSDPYTDEGETMSDVVVVASIYMYATQEKAVRIDDSFPHPPLIDGIATEKAVSVQFPKQGDFKANLTIETSEKTPHGSYFSQSTYFVSLSMSFNLSVYEGPVVLKSRGCFSDEEWNNIVSFEGDDAIVNRTYLRSLGVDGLIPDSSFGIKVPIPRWPLALIIIGGSGLSFLAVYYYVLENPGRHPKLEKRFYQLRGKLSELRGKLEHRGRK